MNEFGEGGNNKGRGGKGGEIEIEWKSQQGIRQSVADLAADIANRKGPVGTYGAEIDLAIKKIARGSTGQKRR